MTAGSEDYQLLSSSRAAQSPWHDRLDPVYEIDWRDALTSDWRYPSVTRHVLVLTPSGVIDHDELVSDSPVRVSERELYGPAPVLAMSMLNQWPVLSTVQISCLLGVSQTIAYRTMNGLYAAGVVERKLPDWVDYRHGEEGDVNGSGYLWRTARRKWTYEQWVTELPSLEHSLVFNGVDEYEIQRGATSSMSLRHDLICAEVGIRAQEACPDVVGVWGAGVSTAALLMPERARKILGKWRNSVADLTVVTSSGKVIVFEVTAAANSQSERPRVLAEKAAAWAAVAALSDIDVSVVFLSASQGRYIGNFTSNIRIGIEKVIKEYLVSESLAERGRASIHVANGFDWFPLPRSLSSDFTTMLSTRVIDGERVPLLGDTRSNPVAREDFVISTLAALHTPDWIVTEVG